jgi:transposase
MPRLAYGRVYTVDRVEARKLLIETYEETGNLSETARRWQTSRHVVSKWVRRYQAEGEAGLEDQSRRPHNSPRQTPPEIEEQVMDAGATRPWEKTGYGRRRLAHYLAGQGLEISPHTIRLIFRRHRPPQKRVRRNTVYPDHWAWDVEDPFSLIQTDGKDILDKGALGTQRTTHMLHHGLPRYQWTACESRTRLRFLAYSHRLNRTNGLSFMMLTLMWLRAFGIETSVTLYTVVSPQLVLRVYWARGSRGAACSSLRVSLVRKTAASPSAGGCE